MKPDKQRIAIAEYCGTDIYLNDVLSDRVPDYLNDLNAMHEAEKSLDVTNGGPVSSDCLRYAYSSILYKLVPVWVQPFRATAAQRAEAFLKTVGKWEE